MNKDMSLQKIKGIGPKKYEKFSRLGLYTIEDAFYNYPRTYANKGNFKLFKDLESGEYATVKARVVDVKFKMGKFKKGSLSLRIFDGVNYGNVMFFNAPFLKDKFKIGTDYYFFGQIKKDGVLPAFFHPEYYSIDEEKLDEKLAITPIYNLTDGVSQHDMLKLHREVINNVEALGETLPREVIKESKLRPLGFAIREMHFPTDKQSLLQAKYRVIFEEFFNLQAGLLFLKSDHLVETGIKNEMKDQMIVFYDKLPFELTNSQKKVVDEIFSDMCSEKVMSRLIQGDVGSGKTVVAMASMYLSYLNGNQSVLMAPTEILAEQHYESFCMIFNEIGVRVELLTGSTKKKAQLKERLKDGEIDMILGTHALIEDDIEYKNLGLVITDEQHRFGVNQRTKLSKGTVPDVVVMSATPIPRTLSLILYGDVDVSTIDTLPSGRKEIQTNFIDEANVSIVHKRVEEVIEGGGQAYYVCPLVEESDMLDLVSAEKMFEDLTHNVFKKYNVGLIHGKLKAKEKDAIMTSFADGDIHILVATTVIEVGINVPNATVMVINDCNRFGLSQLHQLRGRVGRGSEQSYCYLVGKKLGRVAKERVKTMEESTDGFVISEKDLILRGPGEFFGVKQHGLPQLKIGDLAKHGHILKDAQDAVIKFIKNEMLLEVQSPEKKEYIGKLKEKLFKKFSI